MLIKILLPELKDLIRNKKFKEIKDILPELNEQDIVDVLSELSEAEKAILFRLLPKPLAVNVFGELESRDREDMLTAFQEGEILSLLEDMPPDERTELFEEMPASFVRRYLTKLSPEERIFSTRVLNYPEDSVARLVTDEYLTLQRNINVREALKIIRKTAGSKETVYYCYVIDTSLTLKGVVSLKELLVSPDEMNISEIMKKNVVSIPGIADQEEALKIFKKYDFLALPVVDNESKIIGIITFDDIMDVETEEVTEDFHKMSAMAADGERYFDLPVLKRVWKRVPWLFLLLFTATFSGKIIEIYDDALSRIVALAYFIPILLGAGGNAGSQSATIVVRGLATGEIDVGEIMKILTRELGIGIILGALLALFGFFQAYYLVGGNPDIFPICFVVSITLICNITLATLVGSFLPLIFKKFKLDPAVMSGPFISTIVDAFGLIVYLEIAKLFLHF